MPRWSEILPPEVLEIGDRLTEKSWEARKSGMTLYPPHEALFRALALTRPEALKCLILGQDPYHGPGQADGLAFSVPEGIAPPPSLVNIFKELVADVPGMVPVWPRTGDLSRWARNGVMLLNTSLTVYHKSPASCVGWGWDAFTKAVVMKALELPQPVMFVLWGRHAQNFVADVDISRYPDKAVIMSSHPSPYSAASTRCPFVGSRPFSRTNAWLISRNAEPVDWRLED